MMTGEPFLRQTGSGLELVCGELSLRGDFGKMRSRIRRSELMREGVVRAFSLHKTNQSQKLKLSDNYRSETLGEISENSRRTNVYPVILDATAGLGEDSFLLAAAGAEVYLFESDPYTAALLRDALLRALADPDLSDIAARMHLIESDSVTYMKSLSVKPNNPCHTGTESSGNAADPALNNFVKSFSEQNLSDDTYSSMGNVPQILISEDLPIIHPDMIYLDPMFPARTKSGLVKKKAQILQILEHPCENEEEMLTAALGTGARRIVVKRPKKGPYLAGRKPSYSLEGSVVRFDCYVKDPH